MKKAKIQLDKEYKWGMQLLLYIKTDMMSGGGPCETFADIAQEYAEDRTGYSQGIQDYLQSVKDLQLMAEKEMDSWQVIADAAYIWFDNPENVKKCILEEIIPPLIAEAEKRGWKKPASVAG